MNFEDLYDGMDVTLTDPITNERENGVLTAYDFPNTTGEAFKLEWISYGFNSDGELKDQTDIEFYQIQPI